jgi:hypothetical protein
MINTFRLEEKLEKEKKDRVTIPNAEKSPPQQNSGMEKQT